MRRDEKADMAKNEILVGAAYEVLKKYHYSDPPLTMEEGAAEIASFAQDYANKQASANASPLSKKAPKDD